jgi:hypothetical protein
VVRDVFARRGRLQAIGYMHFLHVRMLRRSIPSPLGAPIWLSIEAGHPARLEE